jgi:NADH:ubiquinone oxidoreductase subunit F (NADH-binding)
MFEPKIIKKIKKAGLIGRGSNVFPVAKKWEMVKKSKERVKFVVCNISESEPGVFKDKYILENHTEEMFEGIFLAMDYLKAEKGIIYLNPEYFVEFQEKLQNIIKDYHYNVELFEKPEHNYIGGEETTALNIMDGERMEPRLRPPYPTEFGFQGKPTLVNNAETFYDVSLINKNEFDNKKLYSFSGDTFEEEKVLELDEGLTISQALKEAGHTPNKKYFYQVGGGAAGACLNYKQLNKKFASSASVIVYKVETSEKELVLKWANYFFHESCGQCVPCREGTYRLKNILENHYLADKKLDQEMIAKLFLVLKESSFCALGKVVPVAIESYWQNVKQYKFKLN